jgi:hypothetical protein
MVYEARNLFMDNTLLRPKHEMLLNEIAKTPTSFVLHYKFIAVLSSRYDVYGFVSIRGSTIFWITHNWLFVEFPSYQS